MKNTDTASRMIISSANVEIAKALIDRAVQGDTSAIKLAYQRFENWAPPCWVEKDHAVKIDRLDQLLAEIGEEGLGRWTKA